MPQHFMPEFNDHWSSDLKKHSQYYPNINSEYQYKKKINKDIVTIYTLFPNLDRYAVGVQETLKVLQKLNEVKPNNYPPCNITQFGDKYEIEIAIAGFSKQDISLSVQDQVLTVESNLPDEEDVEVGKVIHHGIAQRNFKHTFALGQYVEVDKAEMKDGILKIKLITNIPDEKKPKSIDIN
jgi:molecular chaperone IbpA